LGNMAVENALPDKSLKCKRVLVLGAASGFGRTTVRALYGAGAQVVAADSNAGGLVRITGAVPLTLRGAAPDALRRAGRAWGEARLDAVLNLMPLRHPVEIDLNIAVLQSTVQGFMPALCARQGQILTVVARPEQPLDLAAGAMGPALAHAQSMLADALRRDGLTLNLVRFGADGSESARAAISGLLSGALGPVTGAELCL
jgi:NAD(P)-dependent dehydrogenase (short-subunit alcohol dehydrogenase family)